MSFTFSRSIPVFLTILCFSGAWTPEAAQAADSAIKVRASQDTATGRQLTLDVAKPKVELVQERDGRVYSKIKMTDAGNENVEGLPSLPVLVQTEEVPWNAQVQVSVQERNNTTLKVKNWIYPHQPPLVKSGTLPTFVLNRDYYEGKLETGLLKAKGVSGPDIMTYKKAGRSYVDIRIRPFAYDPVKGTLSYPQQLDVSVTWTTPVNPGAKVRLNALTVEVTVPDKSAVQTLIDEGYDIVTRHGNVVTLSVTQEELTALRAKGYGVLLLNQSRAPEDFKGVSAYHTYATLTTTLQGYATTYPSICRLVSLGKSVQGRDIWALKITDNPDVAEDEPEIKYAATIHGNESLGTEMCLEFSNYLLSNYTTVVRAANLVNATELWIVPLINPDGLEAGTRENAGGIDLNRGFPEGSDSVMRNVLSNTTLDTTGRAPEVAALMEWGSTRRFTVGAIFHTGALVFNYPFDNDGLGIVNSPTPDDAVFQSIAEIYAQSNSPMWNSTEFTHGITNGADWYTVSGGIQDWFYRYLGCDEATIELSDVFQPSADQLPTFWANNQESMLDYAETALTGLGGLITDSSTGDPVSAAVYLAGNYHPVFTDPTVGDYHREVLPGTYDVTVIAKNYLPRTIQNVVVSAGAATRLNVQLESGSVNRGTVLVVSNSSLATAAESFRSEKEAQLFETHALTVSGASASSTAIRHAIASAYRAHPLDYVILLGDTDTLPAFLSSDGSTSDLLYRLLDDGETFYSYAGKDVMLGRVSVATGTDLANYVQKLTAYSNAQKHNDMTWISHGYRASEYATAENSHQWVMQNALPAGINNETFFQGQGTSSNIINHINAGTDAIVYSGHGDWDTWVGYDFDVTKVALLDNTLDAPIVFGHCCQSGAFQHPVCFAESWLYTSARGIAYVGASADTYWDEDDTFERQEFKAMHDTPALYLADAVEYAQDRIRTTSPTYAQYYATIYHVFGDPTVALFGGGDLAITSPSPLPLAYPGETYEETLTASNGTQPYTWRLVSGALPANLTFNAATGTISGTPSTTGTVQLTFEVRDATSATDTAQLTLRVVNRFQITTDGTLPDGKENNVYSTTLQSSGGTSPATWTLAASGAYEELTTTTVWDNSGVAKGWNDDENLWNLTLPFSFPFYGTLYSSIYVGSNGYIDFASGTSNWNNSDNALSSARRIAVLWADLTTAGTGNNVYVSSNSSRVVIQWQASVFHSSQQISFEVILYPTGKIECIYGAGITGLNATVGVSAGNGLDYTLGSLDNAVSITQNTATRFAYIAGLPPGLALSTGGVISGTPLASGEYTALITAHDAASPSQQDSRAFTITVATGDNPSTGCSMQAANGKASPIGDGLFVLGITAFLWFLGRGVRKPVPVPIHADRKRQTPR